MKITVLILLVMLASSPAFAGSSIPSFEQLKATIVASTNQKPSFDLKNFRVVSITQQAEPIYPGQKIPYIFIACYYQPGMNKTDSMFGIAKFAPGFSLDPNDVGLVGADPQSRSAITASLCH